MLIQVDRLQKRPQEVAIKEPATGFAVLDSLVVQKALTFTTPLQGQLSAVMAGDIIEVFGHISTSLEMTCSRCLTKVPCDLNIDIHLCYSETKEDVLEQHDELELQKDQMGLISYAGKEIDIRPDIEQEIIMALPQHVLCHNDCRGLCPVCGIDLNSSKCSCEPPVFLDGLAALKDFKVKS